VDFLARAGRAEQKYSGRCLSFTGSGRLPDSVKSEGETVSIHNPPSLSITHRWHSLACSYSFDSLLRLNFIMAESTAKTLKFQHEDTKSQSSLFIMLVSPCLCDSIFAFLQ
jgi:hypothetical protein